MKKLFLIACMALTGFLMQAQEKAVGLRFSNGAEVTFQKAAGETNRLELDLGLSNPDDYNVFALTGTYQWTFPLIDIKGLGWYVGPGASLGMWSYDNGNSASDDNGFNVSIGGIIGVDYIFSGLPLQLSLDSRPMIKIVGEKSYSDRWLAFSARYLF